MYHQRVVLFCVAVAMRVFVAVPEILDAWFGPSIAEVEKDPNQIQNVTYVPVNSSNQILMLKHIPLVKVMKDKLQCRFFNFVQACADSKKSLKL